MRTKLLKKIWITAAVLIILAAVISSLFRSLTPMASQYKANIEQQLSLMLGQEVRIQSLETGWYWFDPILRMKHVSIYNNHKKEVEIDKFFIGINLLQSLWHWRVQPGVLYIEDLHLNARQEKDGQWHVEGFAAEHRAKNELSEARLRELLVWFSRQNRFILKNVSIRFQLANGVVIPLSGFNLSVANRGGHYKLKGAATLLQPIPTTFQLLGDLLLDPLHPEGTRGSIYFSGKRIQLSQWLSMLPDSYPRIKDGKATINLWLDVYQGAFSKAQAEVYLKKTTLNLSHTQALFVKKLQANMSWVRNPRGWELKADHVRLNLNGLDWPQNSFMIRQGAIPQNYQLFIEKLPLELFLSSAKGYLNAKPYKPEGILSDTQLWFSPEGITYALTRFDALGFNIPKTSSRISNLSGVLSWQPEEGKLELDSKQAVLNMKGYPQQVWTTLQGIFDWKQISSGLRLSVEHLLLVQPDMTLTGQGILDNLTADGVDNVRARVDFSGKHLEQWLNYLPRKLIKPKLYTWLTRDIKKINSGAGNIQFEGPVHAFPFDKQEGNFSITAHASGGELFINPQWMPVKDIDAYVRLNNRNLEFDLVHAELNSVIAKNAHLRIDDIGKDRENLLIHTLVDGRLDKMTGFVLASPLKQKLKALNMLTLKGNGGLELRIQVPLYPENDEVLVSGELTLHDNGLKLQHDLGALAMDDLTGIVDFDERGVTYSALKAKAMGYPVDIQLNTIKKPQPMTVVKITGICTIDALKKQYPSTYLNLVDGSFNVSALLKLTDNPNDLDHITLSSDLKGLAVHLPYPLGKNPKESRASDLDIGFQQGKGLRLKGYYNDILSMDARFEHKNRAMTFHSGELRIGSRYAVDQQKPGLLIAGSLQRFDIDVWSAFIKQQLPSGSSLMSWSNLRGIDVTLGRFKALGQNMNDLSVKAKPLPGGEWSMALHQQNLMGDLIWNPGTYTLSGHLSVLHLFSSQEKTAAVKIKPTDVPHLNLRIDELSYDAMNLGAVTLKSHAANDRLTIDYGRIDSKEYQIDVRGVWVQQDKHQRTDVDINMQTSDLAASLERWQITPAVDAGRGEIALKGGWNDAITNFSLARFKGTLDLKLKNGIITHLSPETEEKLGLGKLLSILSLQTIPRRLQLDFSDLSHDGFSFDIFKGHFDIHNGIMSTQDSYLDGPVAYAGMKGDLDLVKHLYDLNLDIEPHITASLPIVATIAGGPIAGIATWVASKLISKGIQNISGYTYKVSGPWDQPVVQQIKMVKKNR